MTVRDAYLKSDHNNYFKTDILTKLNIMSKFSPKCTALLFFYRARLLEPFLFPVRDIPQKVQETITILRNIKDDVRMSFESRLILYDAQMLIALLHHTVRCNAMIDFFESGQSHYMYALDMDWVSMPRSLFRLYLCHVSRLLYCFPVSVPLMRWSWDMRFVPAMISGILHGITTFNQNVNIYIASTSGYTIHGVTGDKVLRDPKRVSGRHHKWILDAVMRQYKIHEREIMQRNHKIISIDKAQQKHIDTLVKNKQSIFSFKAPSWLDNNRLCTDLNRYMEFLYRFEKYYSNRLTLSTGFMLIYSSLPHEWMFGHQHMNINDQRRWVMFLPSMYRHLDQKEGQFVSNDKRISWGKKYYGSTLLYYGMLSMNLGCSEGCRTYFGSLRDKLLNQSL